MLMPILRLKIRNEIEQLKSQHRIQIAEKEAALVRKETDLKSEHEMKTREVVSLLKLESQQQLKKMELDYQNRIILVKKEADDEILRAKEGLLADHYNKLSLAMAKLHEEGNVTTRFTQELALKMFENAPQHKTPTKVLTGNCDVDKV